VNKKKLEKINGLLNQIAESQRTILSLMRSTRDIVSDNKDDVSKAVLDCACVVWTHIADLRAKLKKLGYKDD